MGPSLETGRRWDLVPAKGSRASIEWVGGGYIEGVVVHPTTERNQEVVTTVAADDGWQYQVKKLFRFRCWHPDAPGPRKWLRVAVAAALSTLVALILYRADRLDILLLAQAATCILIGFFIGRFWVKEDIQPSFWDWIIIVPATVFIISFLNAASRDEYLRLFPF